MKESKKPKKTSAKTTGIAIQDKVSQNCDEIGWSFKVYVSSVGNESLQKTIDSLNTEQDADVIQYFKARLRYLKNTPKMNWNEPHAKKLSGIKDIYEIKFSANNVEYRPLGFFGPGKKEFTILIWATHKQRIYAPHDAINTADKRRKYIESGKASSVPLKIDGEEFPCAEES